MKIQQKNIMKNLIKMKNQTKIKNIMTLINKKPTKTTTN